MLDFHRENEQLNRFINVGAESENRTEKQEQISFRAFKSKLKVLEADSPVLSIDY